MRSPEDRNLFTRLHELILQMSVMLFGVYELLKLAKYLYGLF
jgi:uncharacterized protein YhhL (DUF1145 family)